MYVLNKQSDDESVRQFQPSRDLLTRIRRRWRRQRIQRAFARYDETRPDGLEPFTDDRTPFAGRIFDQMPSADVINLHWIRGFVDLQVFFERVSVPVVWTLHDMNAFTGGCHYNVGCEKYAAACGACPQLGSDDEQDLSRAIRQRKSEAYQSAIEADQLNIVAPSQWLAQEARRSSLLQEAPISVIPNGLDTAVFQPRETAGLRQAIEIPDHHQILLFVAQSTQNHRKGFDLLQKALGELSGDHMTLVSIGSHKPKLEADLPHVHLGSIQSDLLLSVFYSAADVFVIPSLQDNLPNTVLESMACGTPVVGFDTGGIPDMVRPGETGWLADTGNVPALRKSIETALADDDARQRLGERCREVVENEYTLEVQAQRYSHLYQRLSG
jgi:glycosyltransferase involved in cell wall biosynthesis